MTTGELIKELQKFPSEMEVLTKKTEICGNVAYCNSVRADSYGFFGKDIPCVLISDEYEDSEDGE